MKTRAPNFLKYERFSTDLPVNPFKRAIHAGEQEIGLWTNLASTLAIEIASGSGFDWLLLDTSMHRTNCRWWPKATISRDQFKQSAPCGRHLPTEPR